MVAPVLLSHPSSLRHDTGGHPERPDRIVAIEHELRARGGLTLDRRESRPASPHALRAVHDPRHVERIRRLSAAGGGQIDIETLVSEGSWEAALHAAGGAVDLVDAVVGEPQRAGFSIHRPPGHHADAMRAMGFCLFNNVAVGAAHALAAHGLSRVMVLDWDVHHGNGTADIFQTTDSVLYVSIHQSPLYPGTGASSDRGTGAGLGHTVNLPVSPGAGNEVFSSLVEHVVVPIAQTYSPQLILVSAGYDAHAADPLAQCEVTEDGYREMTRSMRRLALGLGVGLGLVLEGGYEVGALARSVAATLEVLGEGAPTRAETGAPHPVALAARRRWAQQWSGLAVG